MPDIFLSYSREDQQTAHRFAEAFRAEDFDVWWDAAVRFGETFDEVIETALRTAKAVVVLWSPRSVASRWVRAEATLADRNKTLAPVIIEPCERPIIFELTQTADLSHWRGELNDAAWRSLVEDVRQFVVKDAPAEPRRPAPIVRPSSPTRGRRGGAPSLAVLPFANRSGLAEDEVFAFGMVEDIIDAMSQGTEVRVISSSATARFRNGGITDLAALARELGVRYVLEGNVRRVGQDLRVTTQLVEAESGNILWTQKFERPLAQLAFLQEELVLEVAAHLRSQSYRREIERALRKPGDLTAWEAVMRSIAAYRRMTGPALLMGLEEARKAMEIAPDYGVAIALYAQAQAVLYNQVMPDDPSEAQRIRTQAERAIAIEPDNSTVLSVASGALSAVGSPQEGLAAGRRAIELNRYNPFGYFASGMAAALLDLPEEAVGYFDKELQLSPDNPTIWISYTWRATSLFRAGRWVEAAEAYDQALRLTPDNAAPNLGKAVCCRELGRLEEAGRFAALARKLEPETPLSIWELRYGRSTEGSDIKGVFLNHLRELWAGTEPEAGAELATLI
jgi:TolB-like protein/Tfp pilus assembly protein PilF